MLITPIEHPRWRFQPALRLSLAVRTTPNENRRLRKLAGAVATAAATLLVAASPAAAGDTVVGTLTEGTRIDALAGHVLWSEPGPGSKRWHLVDLHDGRQRRLDVPASAAPFDVDLGRDRRGRLVAVYSRCRRPRTEETFGRAGCDVHRYDFATARESKVGAVSVNDADDAEPTLWGSRIAFVRETLARTRDGYEARRAAYTRNLRKGGRLRRLRTPESALPSAPDARAGAIAMRSSRSFRDSVRVVAPGQRARTLIATPGRASAERAYGTINPTFGDARTVYWGLGSFGPDWLEIWRRDVHGGPLERATIRIAGTVELFAQDGEVSYYALDDDPDDDASPLKLHRLDGLRFERAPRLTLG